MVVALRSAGSMKVKLVFAFMCQFFVGTSITILIWQSYFIFIIYVHYVVILVFILMTVLVSFKIGISNSKIELSILTETVVPRRFDDSVIKTNKFN